MVMILIDKAKTTQELILTLTEKSTVNEPAFVLVFTSDALNAQHEIPLGDFMVTTNERYDLFQLPTYLFNDVQPGYYTYVIYQDANKALKVETGKLLVKDVEQPIEIISPKRNEGYLVYDE